MLQRLWQKLWYNQPVRIQLLVAVCAINLLAALAASAVSILNTRTATRVEIESSLDVAQRFVAATVRDLAAQGRLDELREQLPRQLKHLRHVRILFIDPMGQFTELAPEASETGWMEPSEQAPGWFAALVRPRLEGRAVRVVTTESMNPIVIVGEPADEIAEAWNDFSALVLVWLALGAVILVILYVVLGRVLEPLANLSSGMANLEDGDYATRLPVPKVQELAVITNRFNTLASALDVAQEENSRLYRQLISVQESERREIANELHDEAGPCLFGITANASSIKTLTGQEGERATKEISMRVGEILSIVERLKQLNRGLIKRLRPGPLGEVRLSDLLEEQISNMQRSHPETEINAELGELAKSYGEQADLTIYRCLQEGITNAIRHGRAKHIFIDLKEEGPAAEGEGATLRLVLRDDGSGIAPGTPKGFGLTTMNERVLSLKGSCEIDSSRKGTTLRIAIPVSAGTAKPAQLAELVGGLT
ncbi:ATP-binding protein [Methyloligella sp. 2.7D]|uniref:ATP-binding protein n=1 Tax=unclassified Methyloligella TaxID=2625955 RepID=UPI00157BFD3A|nr:ATP-binding protein [Methyloligella sp. GL2]QKP78060.1 HAMP domain-containing protein [Methyloligella sp. GL2]